MLIKRDQIEPIVEIGETKLNINAMIDKSITKEQFQSMKTNLIGFKAILPKLDNDALEWVTSYYVKNSGYDYESTYNHLLKHSIIPELIKRLKELSEN